MILDINNSPTDLKEYQDNFKYYQGVKSNAFSEYGEKEDWVAYITMITFLFEIIFLPIGFFVNCCSNCSSDKPKMIYNYLCNIAVIALKSVFMKFLLQLRDYRINSIKPLISEYIENEMEMDIIEFRNLNDEAAETDMNFFIINIILCIIIFIFFFIITVLLLKEKGYCNNCTCDCNCTQRNYNSSNNYNTFANINNNNANNASENIYRNIRQNSNAVVNSNENVNRTSTRNLIRTKYKAKNTENCIICQQLININDEVIYLPCVHFFHVNCINCWINMKKYCPICRRPI